MRNSVILILIALLAVSCRSEIISRPDVSTQSFAVKAGYYETKSTLDGEGHVCWEAGDSISVFSSSGVFPVSTRQHGRSAYFYGEGRSEDDMYMLYPAGSGLMTGTGTISACIPVQQKAPAGSFARKANVSAALSKLADGDGTCNATFRNVGSYIRFDVATSSVSKIVIRALGGEYISGDIDVNVKSETDISATGGCCDSVVVTPVGADCFEQASYYAVVLPGSLSSGIRVTVHNVDRSPDIYDFDSIRSLPRNTVTRITTELGEKYWNTWTDAESLKALLAKAPSKGKVYTSQFAYYDYTNITGLRVA